MEDRSIDSTESKNTEAYDRMREWHDRQGVDARYGWSRVAPRYRRAPKASWLGAALILCGIVPIGIVALGYWFTDGAVLSLSAFLASNLILALLSLILLAAGIGTLLTGSRKE